MKQRTLGSSGIAVGEIGFGCMGLTWAYGEPFGAHNERDAIAVLHRAVDLGVTLFDTADMYGPFTNERLVGKALAGRRERVTIATKCGMVVHDAGSYDIRRDARPQHIAEACEASLKRLNVDVIDLYQLHRVDPNVPVEESVGAMAELVRQGKVRAIGLSEVDVATMQRAAAVHPIASLQSEFSLWERNVMPEILPWCERHGITLIAYSPLGRGFLTGRLKKSDIATGDFRAILPRFQGEAFDANARIVEKLASISSRLGATPGQIALAWVLAVSAATMPIPGTKHLAYVEENARATEIALTPKDLAELAELELPMGARY